MRILFIHQNFPGQFRHAAGGWSQRPGWRVLAVGRDTAPGLPGVRLLRYKPHRSPHKTQHPYLRTMEGAVLHGQAVARVLERLKASGYTPDAIVAHPGWGETLYAKDIFPNTRLVHYCEWYYASEGQDFGFDPEFPVTLDDKLRIRTWNALHLLNLQNCDAGITPTQWQWSRHPEAYRGKITVAHEGIDAERLKPDPNATITILTGSNKGLIWSLLSRHFDRFMACGLGVMRHKSAAATMDQTDIRGLGTTVHRSVTEALPRSKRAGCP